MTDERDCLPRLELEVDVVQDRAAGCVFEGDVLVANLPVTRRHLRRIRLLRDLLGLVHDLEDPLAGRGRALGLADPHPEHAERHDEHDDEDVEEEERPEVERPVRDHPAADEEDARLHDQRQEREQGHVERALLVRVDAAVEDPLGAVGELVELVPLLRERLDDVDADDVLLGDGGDVRHLLLHVSQDRMGDARVAVRDDHDQRRDRGRDEREAPVDDEHDRGGRDDREDVLEEEDEPVAQEEAHRLEVDRRAREELAGLVSVVEAERQAEELRVERVAHVELDAERLPPRDEPAAGHEERARHPDGEDERGDDIELARLRRRERLPEPRPGQVRHPDRGRLGADGEQDGDDQRPLVRLEEAEQAHECLSIQRLRCHSRNLAFATCLTVSRAVRLLR